MVTQATVIPSNYGDHVDQVVRAAIQSNASDIHFDPEQDYLNVRFRVDGLLLLHQRLTKMYQEQISTRIKILAHMDISEHRLPQDGHFEFKYDNNTYNIRVSTLPTTFGETIVMRLFNRNNLIISLENLGVNKEELTTINSIIKSPSGMLIITGPTGSGKTTFLYSVLHVLDTPEKNIITLEDPVEFQMDNIRQLQIKEDIGLTFAKSMRSVVRQDPDVVMLGEIRDVESAQMAVQAALIGIFVLTTYHTFDAPALITRFVEMGITGSVVAEALRAAISVRLVRKICNNCKAPYEPTEFEKQYIGELKEPCTFQKGKGCELCKNSGYLGRTGVFEIMMFDKDIKSHIIEKKPLSLINNLLKEKKVKNLKEAAIEKIKLGVTTIEEIIRVIGIS